MRKTVIFSLILLLYSCISIKIIPKIDNYKILKAKKFSKKLPKTNAFVFKNPKKSGEIQAFIQAKFNSVKELDNYYSFKLNGITHAITFYEVEKQTNTVNLIPVLIDVSRQSKNKDPILNNFYVSRLSDNWFVTIIVHNEESANCLANDYVNRKDVEKYLEQMKNEYLNTSNYLETFFLRNK